ncbi:MipA/OmpV family protein [Kordiimonas sp. SCSIO 12610]|uniref:MipA/OmpV family protein n=1 Tax=Kordiimonas sp. SCSIO 12610 TaxID=2829597 RepID=UPI00210BB825|nr:MipA/OmpV family protein [Kordiimonas sp. SCSIO 12610]UTW56553.1 MipA/OmpV family protein [Kordiimonas sp. SCSIO 12610]
MKRLILNFSVFTVFSAIMILIAHGAVAQAPDAQVQQPPQRPQGPQRLSDWEIDLGAGALFSPVFAGSDEYQLSLLPSIRLTFKNRFFASVQKGAGYNIINDGTWRVGPILRYAFPRDENGGTSPFAVIGGNTDALIGLGDVAGTFELGGFAEYRTGAWRFKAETRQGLNGHEGLVGELEAAFQSNISSWFYERGRPILASVGARAIFTDDDFNQAYFGVNQNQSLASGLPEFDAGGGLYSVSANAQVIYPYSRRLSIIGFSSLERLTGDVADSPLVIERGSRNQFTMGIFFSYKFGL